jgi:phosphomannomutase
MQTSASAIYQCPNESYPISQAVHLGRLTSFYPQCRQCPHSHDTGTLSSGIVSMLDQTRKRPAAGNLFHQEGVSGVYLNELSPAVARRVSAALGLYLARQDEQLQGSVVIAGDGRALSSELVAAASDGLRWAGCRVVDLGAVNSAAVVYAMHHLQAAGGLLVGNAGGEPNTGGIKMWGAAGRPLSAGGALEAVQQKCAEGMDRPRRSYGGLGRFQADSLYLSRLEAYFHALRPLRLVLDTSCKPLVGYWQRLSSNVACQAILLREAGNERTAARGGLAERVRNEQAHLGIWIDGDGETCRVVDERGLPLSAEQVLILLGRHILNAHPGATIILEQNALASTAELLSTASANVVHSDSSRASMDESMRRHGAALGGGPGGRYWFGSQPAAADGLEALSLLLTVLSQSDRNLSEISRKIQ